MSTKSDNIVGVTSLSLSNDIISRIPLAPNHPRLFNKMDILRRAVLGLGVNIELTLQGSGFDLLEQSITSSLADSNSWGVWAQWVGNATQGSTECAILVVVDHGANCGGSTSQSGLVSEWTVASRDQSNAAGDILWVIGLQNS